MNKEYTGSVGLIILGQNMDPSMVSKALGMRPTQQWRTGELKTLGKVESKRKHKYGGWKKYPPAQTGEKAIEDQLMFWARKLNSKRKPFERLRAQGCQIYLDIFATTSATISMIWPTKLVSAFAKLELDVYFSISAHKDNVK